MDKSIQFARKGCFEMASDGQKKILVLNSGSSSLKYEVFLMPDKTSLGKGSVERIGEAQGFLTQTSPKGPIRIDEVFPDHKHAMLRVGQSLVDPAKGIIARLEDIEAIGHRVVHGGERFASSVRIDDDVIAALTDNIELAPLHNPANLTGIREATQLWPAVPQVGVFDTAFHQTMSPTAYLYGLPREL